MDNVTTKRFEETMTYELYEPPIYVVSVPDALSDDDVYRIRERALSALGHNARVIVLANGATISKLN